MKKKGALFPDTTTFRSSGREIIPPLLDSFLAGIDSACKNEHHPKPLHAKRLQGKQLRYAMEIYLPAYGDSFAPYLDSVKEVLVVMGRIHDLDVNLPVLKQHERQIRCYNAITKERSLKMETTGIIILIQRLEQERHECYISLRLKLSRWKEEMFRRNFIASLSPGSSNAHLSTASCDSGTTGNRCVPKR
jgi:hypothetical protein